MRKDYSAPVITGRPARSTQKGGQQAEQEEKQVDYSHLDIIAEVERITGCSLSKVSRKGVYSARCPFPGCPSMHDAFTVWDIPILGKRENGKPEVHFWCRRCDRSGDLISLIRQYREAVTGEAVTWKEAARELGIDLRTWRAFEDGTGAPQAEQRRSTASERRQREREQAYKAEQAEIDLLGAWYHRARAWLAAGRIVMKDGRQIALDTALAYLQERGFSPEQAALLGLAYMPTAKEFPEIANDKTLAPWRGRILFPLAGPKGASGYAGRSLFRWKPGMLADQHKKLLDAWNERRPEQRIARYWKTRRPAYYGYEEACRASTLVIVEGEFDAASVRLALSDMPDIAVCAFGKEFQARLVPLNVLKVILALDGDQAGQEAITRQVEELEARGVTVEIARPPAGKDWNDCLLLAGLAAIRAAIAPEQAEENRGKQRINESADAGQQRPIEPPGYEHGDICLLCGQQIEDREGAFYVVEDKASALYGDLFCMPCWERYSAAPGGESTELDRIIPGDQGELASAENHEKPRKTTNETEQAEQRAASCLARVQEIFEGESRGAPVWPEPVTIRLLPAGMSSAEYIERWYAGERPGRVIGPAITEEIAAQLDGDQGEQHRCSKHGKPLVHGDEMGGRYCNHVDCWERYRLIRAGARRGYPALSAILDQRDYMPDLSAAPLRYTASGLPVYPARPVVRQQIIAAGADAWRAYVAARDYQAIDQAVKALASA